MGEYLSEPIKEKNPEDDDGPKVCYRMRQIDKIWMLRYARMEEKHGRHPYSAT